MELLGDRLLDLEDKVGLAPDVVRIAPTQRRSRTMMMGMARRVHPDMDASGYALIVQVGVATEAGRGGVRASQVAEALGLDKSRVSRSVAHMERLGVIERVGDPEDGRARLLRLTKDGAKRYTAVRDQRHAEFDAILRRAWNVVERAYTTHLPWVGRRRRSSPRSTQPRPAGTTPEDQRSSPS